MEHIPLMEVVVCQSKLKNLLFLIAGIVVCFFMSACSNYDLNKAQIPDIKVDFCSDSNNDYIVISGKPFNSALVIKKIIINDLGNSINIEGNSNCVVLK